MRSAIPVLLRVLRHPKFASELSLNEWDLLVRQARRAELLGYMAWFVPKYELSGEVPEEIARHFSSAKLVADANVRAVHWEVNRIRAAFAKIALPVLLLKGAAYVMADLPSARGRIFHDIDILVPKDRLEKAEELLLWNGWATTHLDAYDQRYYRTWMHELPPLQHLKRKTILDVHHNIQPPTSRLHPNPDKLLEEAVSIGGQINLKVLAPVDMVLHSATHLFQDGELEHGLRDLVDLDSLMRNFGQLNSFWPQLTERAKELGLARSLYYALRYTHRLLGTPIPEDVQRGARFGRPGGIMPTVMDALFLRALMPDHVSCRDPFTGLARWLLYIRSHYLRMPLYLLIPHLVRKTFRREPVVGSEGEK